MTGYPFSAIVGQQETRLALLLTAVDPRIGGVLLRGEKGTAKSTAARGLARLLPAGRMRTLSLGATEDRLVGGLDLEASIADGRPAFSPGLLAAVDGGVLYVDEVNLLDGHLADLVLDAAASGRNVVEREGVSASHPSRFVLIGTMNPEEGALRPQLLDRFGLCADVVGEADAATRARIVRSRLDFDADPAGFAAGFAEAELRLAARVAEARARVPAVRMPADVLDLVSTLAENAHVAGHRADIVMAEAARAHAAWQDRTAVTEDDVLAVCEMVLRHRRRDQTPPGPQSQDSQSKNPQSQTSPDSQSRSQQPHEPDDRSEEGDRAEDGPVDGQQGSAAAGPDGSGDHGTDSPEDPASSSENPDGGADGTGGTDGTEDEQPPADDVPAVGRAFSVTPIQPGADRMARSGSGRRMTTRSADRRGRYIAARPTELADDLAIDATLRAAALHQRERHDRARADRDKNDALTGRGEIPAVIVEPSDWRRKVRVTRVGSCVLLVVDASGSMGARGRMIAGKGAVLSLLLDAYVRRDKVALISFRRRDAEVLVPPTSSVEVAQRGLAELPVGGRTPLSAGLAKAAEVLRPLLIREPAMRPLAVLVTDGRGNVDLDGRPSRQATDEAVALARRLGLDPRITWVVVDTEDPHGIRLSRSADLARALGAPCLRIEDLRADDLVDVVSRLDPAPRVLPATAPRTLPGI